MKKNDTGASGADDETPAADDDKETAVDDSSGDDETEKPVSRSAYTKTVNEAKKARERARKATEENEALKAQLLAAEGNKDEKIKTLGQQLSEAKKREKTLLGATIKKALSSQVKTEAAKAGSVDSDIVFKLLDLSDVDIDQDTLEADSSILEEKIAELKKSKPFLFSKAGPNLNNKMPNGKKVDAQKEDLSKLSATDIRARLRALDKA